MPIVPNTVDLANWVLYDRITAAQGTTSASAYQFFSQPIGQNSKTKVDTNITMVKMLEAPQWFNAQTIGFEFSPGMFVADVLAFMQAYYFEFWVGQKIYAEGPLDCAQSGYGASFSGYAATTAATTTVQEAVVNNGDPAGMPSFSLVLPAGITDANGQPLPGANGINGVSILQNQSFWVNLVSVAGVSLTATAAGGTGLSLRCFLTGILSRGAQ
jgi:hypothetical protein